MRSTLSKTAFCTSCDEKERKCIQIVQLALFLLSPRIAYGSFKKRFPRPRPPLFPPFTVFVSETRNRFRIVRTPHFSRFYTGDRTQERPGPNTPSEHPLLFTHGRGEEEVPSRKRRLWMDCRTSFSSSSTFIKIQSRSPPPPPPPPLPSRYFGTKKNG